LAEDVLQEAMILYAREFPINPVVGLPDGART